MEDGDIIELNVPEQRIQLLVDESELKERAASAEKEGSKNQLPDRGYVRMYVENVTQAHEGCDFGFLVPKQNK